MQGLQKIGDPWNITFISKDVIDTNIIYRQECTLSFCVFDVLIIENLKA